MTSLICDTWERISGKDDSQVMELINGKDAGFVKSVRQKER